MLRNIGGIDFSDLNTTLMCSDPNITILDGNGYFGFLAIDSVAENTADPYEITVSASTPQGHSAEFTLLAVDGSYVDTFQFNIVVGGVDYLIWNPDLTPVSGQMIDYFLTDIGYSGVYTTMLPVLDLQTYKAIFVCTGVYSHNYVISAASPEATALVNYLNSGGCLYLEGGEVWYYDPMIGGYDFAPLFGINPMSDGTGNLGPVVGQPGTFTQGMFFYYAGENYSMDQIDTLGGNAVLIFMDNDNGYGCGVANDAVAYKTVGTSFELGALVDLGGVSTRSALLDSIMHFFGISPTGIKENAELDVEVTTLQIYPNPFTQQAEIRFTIHDSRYTTGNPVLNIYDVSGRLVKSFSPASCVTDHESRITWDGTDEVGRLVPAGVYFVHLAADKTGDDAEVEKVVVLR